MIRKILRCFATRLVLTLVICPSGLFSTRLATAGQSDTSGPGGTPLACNFNFRLQVGSTLQVGSDPMAASTDCDSYHFYLAKNAYDPAQGTFTVSQRGSTDRMMYHLADMPLNEPVLLLEPNRQPTRVIARRRADRIDFIVGRAAFTGPPPYSLLPRTPSQGSSPTGSQLPVPAGATGTAQRNMLIGSWSAEGVILKLNGDGTFTRVSHSSHGRFGGVIGVDDNGSYVVRGAEIVLNGHLRQRTCSYSQGGQTSLVCDGVTYRKE